MRGKLLFVTGGLVGYVLGARAGRKRYDQIVAAAQDLWSRPPVQRRVNEARDFALERVGDVPSALLEGGRKLVATVQAKTGQDKAGQDKAGRTTGTTDVPTVRRVTVTTTGPTTSPAEPFDSAPSA
ncbi:YtxH domain-containing protein [Cryobacterium sp. TMT2-10]|uniref:YtxH domain-containing protein n=1 Tax=Cryobacterium shii TaxID=1259235 RepID=A0AAQ2C3A5_9MICO|nr:MULTISPECIES: YtxH domain-containing protein [Cryobacterium]TFC41158.1 YtxH domain-containing protein [Cryobacterium shii]TFD40353.1 YtxH domain-containing protein [Cryobacterium sp. TMT2-10]